MVVVKTKMEMVPVCCDDCDFCIYDYEFNSGFICGVLMYMYEIEDPKPGRLDNCPLADVN